jgi:hypothetical protein
VLQVAFWNEFEQLRYWIQPPNTQDNYVTLHVQKYHNLRKTGCDTEGRNIFHYLILIQRQEEATSQMRFGKQNNEGS